MSLTKPYVYSDREKRIEPSAVFNHSNHLVSIFGFHVGELVTFNQETMEQYRKYPFSHEFIQKYPNGIFRVSQYQTAIIFSELTRRIPELSIDVEPHFLLEMNGFFRNISSVDYWGYNDDPLFVCAQINIFVKSFSQQAFVLAPSF